MVEVAGYIEGGITSMKGEAIRYSFRRILLLCQDSFTSWEGESNL